MKYSPWQRLLQQARYHRLKKNFRRSDLLLEAGLEKFPSQPEVYIEYFLNHSKSKDIKNRFQALLKGYQLTKDTVLAFFIGSAYLEEGDFKKARTFLQKKDCKEYQKKRRSPLLAQLFYEMGDYDLAAEEFLNFYREIFNDFSGNAQSILSKLAPNELILYPLIQKARGKNWKEIMALASSNQEYTDMNWNDYRSLLQEEFEDLEPADSGIYGSSLNFNRRRRKYYQERISLVQEFQKEMKR